MSYKQNFIAVMLLGLSTVALNGCNDDCGCCQDAALANQHFMGPNGVQLELPPTNSPIVVPKVTLPNVTGKWSGRWESAGHPGHGGGLNCVATESGPQKWAAVFTAEFGQTKAYDVKLEGKPGSGVVLFGGSVDLGKKDGGIFTWTGQASQTEFTGKYEGGGDTGTFKMTRKDAAGK
jgi:hypothetical protein